MKKVVKRLLFSVLIVFMSGMAVTAAENIRTMEVQDQGDIPVIYVKGIEGEVQSADAVIGNVAASKVLVKPLSEEAVSMKTLILIDNSLSIPEKNRNVVKNVVSELIAGRDGTEQFSIATFGESIEVLEEFTDDYVALKSVLDGIEFKDRETYLTDVLYDLITSGYLEEEGSSVYSRIFVISDGVDNKSLGYTAEELSSLLTDSGVPIYSLGVYNKKQSNDEQLKNMFALSRQTNAESFLLDEVEDIMTIVSALSEDRDIIRFDVVPDAESADGSMKTIVLHIQTSSGEVSVQADNVRMAQKAIEPKVEEVPEPQAEEVNTESDSKDTIILLLVGFMFVAVITIMVVMIILVVRFVKKRKEKNIVRETENPFVNEEPNEEKTEFIYDRAGRSDGDTVQLFGDNNCYTVTLTDVSSPSRSFRKNITDRLVIGRTESKADICIDDKSVSRPHCAIERRGNKFYLADLQSSNGTYLNGTKVLSEVELCSSDIIKLGRVELRVEMS